MHFGSEYFIVSDRFKDAVALLPGETGHGTTLNLLMPYRDRFATQVKELQDWMSGTFTRLEAITSHLRTMPADNRQAATQPWKPVHVAVEHVAERIGDSESSWPLARVALRQAAYDKRVRIRGRKQLADLLPKTTFAKIHTDIDSDYWAVSDLSPLATNSALDEFTHTLPQSAYAWGKRGLEEPMQCTQLLVNWDDVTREWP
jgi:hypothetical protein